MNYRWLLIRKKRNLDNFNSSNNRIKNAQGPGKHCSKEDIQMANGYMKRRSAPLIRERQELQCDAVSYPLEGLPSERREMTRAGGEGRKGRWGRWCERKLVQPLRKTGRRRLKKPKTELQLRLVPVVAQSCLTLCDPMDCSTPGLPVHHQLSELTHTHVHRVGDAIQPSHPLSSPSPPAFNLSQHQGVFQWVSSLHQVAKVLEFQLQHQSFQWIFRTDFL